jgi:hypothetical protein
MYGSNRQDRRIIAIELQPFAGTDKHRHACAVFARVEDLAGLESRGVEVDFAAANERTPSGFYVEPVIAGRDRKTFEEVKQLPIVQAGRRPFGRSQSRHFNIGDRFSFAR